MNLLETSALGRWLQNKNSEYFSAAQGLRRTVERWLRYVAQTFPHYTSHAVDHSDNIIAWLSHLLFEGDDPSKPVVGFSGIEVYALMAAAYLHDAGMVVSDAEKLTILASDEWKRWIETAMAPQWADVQKLREKAVAEKSAEEHFIADLHTRHLIAEFIRRVHHKRAARVVAEYREYVAEYFFHEPMLEQIVSNICVGHGLSHYDLQDEARYPQRTLILHEYANVRWLAILLRLGDLLDMRTDRACPLLLNAASPLPQDSIAHWDQYAAIRTFDVAPDIITIRAECGTREQYQTLRDWCHWIELEVGNAAALMTHAKLHDAWKPPSAIMSGPTPTISINKAEDATFLVDDWKFELDSNTIFDRLIQDVYDEPLAFVRELLQNALDATRVRLYLDLAATGRATPTSPTQIDEHLRGQYPVRIALETRLYRPDPASPEEPRQYLIITDHGVGMDRDVIARFLLQIGRSFYRSAEFLKTFLFVPTSRFGIGFLSTFAVSDHVVVDTYKPSSGDGPIQLTLRGVRNYVLPQRSNRTDTGTQIEILLREPLNPETLRQFVKRICCRVEFPIQIEDADGTQTIRAEQAADLVYDVPSLEVPGGRNVLRVFHVCSDGLEGEIYIPVLRVGDNEFWDFRVDLHNQRHPFQQLRTLASVYSLHGIYFGEPNHLTTSQQWCARIDIRRETSRLPVSRSSARFVDPPDIVTRINAIARQHIDESVSRRPNDRLYRLGLIDRFPLKRDQWATVPRLVRVDHSKSRLMSIGDLDDLPALDTVSKIAGFRRGQRLEKTPRRPRPLVKSLNLVSGVRHWIVAGRHPAHIDFKDREIVITWRARGDEQTIMTHFWRSVVRCTFSQRDIAAVNLSDHGLFVVNANHPCCDWLVRVRDAAGRTSHVTPERFSDLLESLFGYGTKQWLLVSWNSDAIPEELRPPPMQEAGDYAEVLLTRRSTSKRVRS